jgi:drug/metabolite transporter (DMT)-like permease
MNAPTGALGASARHRKGVMLMLGAALCWSSAGMLVRNLDLRDSWEITFWRSAFMSLFVLGVQLVRHRGSVLRPMLAIGLPGLVAGALWALMYLCFIVALGRTTVANVLVLSSITPFTAALMGAVFLHERVPGRTWLAMAAALGGIMLMFLDALERGGLAGNLIALVIPVAFACNVVILRKMHATVDMLPTLLLSGLLSLAVTLPFALPLTPTATDLGLLAVMGVVQLGLGCLLMMAAAPLLSAAEIGLLSVTETLFGTVSTWVVVGEVPGAVALLGGAVVLGALVVNELFGLRQRMRPDEEQAVREASSAGH